MYGCKTLPLEMLIESEKVDTANISRVYFKKKGLLSKLSSHQFSMFQEPDSDVEVILLISFLLIITQTQLLRKN